MLYDAGVDIHINDSLGRLSVTDEGSERRELLVIDTIPEKGIPLAGYVGGGYHKDLNVLARRHCALHRAADVMWRDEGL